MSESSHPPAWPGPCTLKSRPPTSRPQADPKFWIALGRKQYITAQGRKPAELSHINARGRKPCTPHINNQGRKLSGARTSALQAASLGGGGEGEEGSNPPVHREREGRGAIPTPYIHPIPTFL